MRAAAPRCAAPAPPRVRRGRGPLIRAMAQGPMPAAASGVGVRLPGATHQSCIYLDYNATTPIFPEARANALAWAAWVDTRSSARSD
jgi:hypothetical protein